MPERKELILRRLAEEGEKALAFYAGLPPAAWEQKVYADGEVWTVRAVLAHQYSAETHLLRLIQDVLAGGPGAPPDFDLDAFNQEEVSRLANLSPATILPAWQQARAGLLATVEKMSAADFDRRGRHPFLGETSLEEVLRLIYRHNMLHARDVKRALDPSV